MNKLFLLAAVFAVAATRARGSFPDAMLGQLFKRHHEECSPQLSLNLAKCVAPLEFLAHPFFGLHMLGVDNAEQLNLICNELNRVSNCVNATHARCGQGNMLSEQVTATILGVVNHMCRPDGRQVILSNAECWDNQQLGREVMICGLQMQIQDSSMICSSLQTLKRCITQEMEKVCSAEAVNFVDELLYRSMSPMANNVHGCQISMRVSRSLWDMLPRTRK